MYTHMYIVNIYTSLELHMQFCDDDDDEDVKCIIYNIKDLFTYIHHPLF